MYTVREINTENCLPVMFCTILVFLLLLLLSSYLIVFQTPLSISLLRTQMFRPFSQNLTLPSGMMANLSDPARYGLPNTDVLQIPSGTGFLAAWYIRPPTKPDPNLGTVLYLHGRSQIRGYSHRVGLYKMLLEMGFCVLAIDYRGFGDSSDIEIHEETAVDDAINSHNYLRRNYKPQKILVFGHSLGAPIATRLAAQDDDDFGAQKYLVLESSFDTMEHLVENWDDVAWRKFAVHMTGLERADITFRCDEYLSKVSYPVLILHAEDDHKVDLQLAKNLFQTARSAGKEQLAMVTLGRELGLRHTGIYQFQGLPSLVTMFLAGNVLSNEERVCRLPDVNLCELS